MQVILYVLTKYGKDARVEERVGVFHLTEVAVALFRVYAVPILSETARKAAAGEPVNPFDPVILPSGGIIRSARCWRSFEANSKEHVERLFAQAQHDPNTHELVEYRIHSIEKIAD